MGNKQSQHFLDKYQFYFIFREYKWIDIRDKDEINKYIQYYKIRERIYNTNYDKEVLKNLLYLQSYYYTSWKRKKKHFVKYGELR